METGVREHDGFYLRMGIGVGRLAASFSADDSTQLGGSVDGALAHGALVGELGIGGTPAPGLVIGGSISFSGTNDVTTHDLSVNGATVSDLSHQNASMGLFGPMVDYYIDPKLGWHVQGVLGLAWVNVSEGIRDGRPVTSKHNAGGLGFSVGGGWEGWVGKQWSMGALLRLTYASAETNPDQNVPRGSAPVERWAYKAISFPELLFTVTYH
jgi:hypothetical protein